ncbi:12888_t:CDS:2, partial [Racocetra persica]
FSGCCWGSLKKAFRRPPKFIIDAKHIKFLKIYKSKHDRVWRFTRNYAFRGGCVLAALMPALLSFCLRSQYSSRALKTGVSALDLDLLIRVNRRGMIMFAPDHATGISASVIGDPSLDLRHVATKILKIIPCVEFPGPAPQALANGTQTLL